MCRERHVLSRAACGMRGGQGRVPGGAQFLGGFTQEAPEGLVCDWGLCRGVQALRAARAQDQRQDQATKQHQHRAPASPAAPNLCVAKAQKSCFVH